MANNILRRLGSHLLFCARNCIRYKTNTSSQSIKRLFNFFSVINIRGKSCRVSVPVKKYNSLFFVSRFMKLSTLWISCWVMKCTLCNLSSQWWIRKCMNGQIYGKTTNGWLGKLWENKFCLKVWVHPIYRNSVFWLLNLLQIPLSQLAELLFIFCELIANCVMAYYIRLYFMHFVKIVNSYHSET